MGNFLTDSTFLPGDFFETTRKGQGFQDVPLSDSQKAADEWMKNLMGARLVAASGCGPR